MSIQPTQTTAAAAAVACPTCEMESQARAMLKVGDKLVAKGSPHLAVDAYTTAINLFERHVCPQTILWLRLHRSWCFKGMGMNVFTREDLLAIFSPLTRLSKDQRRSKLARKASRFVYLALSRGRACVCGELCRGPAKCGHDTHRPFKPSFAPFNGLFWSR